jgi:Domain of unknown function (DUF4261)
MEKQRLMSLVLLDRPLSPDMDAVAAAIRARHPDIPVSVPGVGTGQSLIVCGGKIIAVMSMPAAAPQDEGVMARAGATWPQVRGTYKRHRAHLVVALMSDNVEPLDAARVVTAVIGGLLAALPGCLGVIWGGRVANPADRFLDMSKQAFAPPPGLPYMLWISIHPFKQGTAFGAVTHGLLSFVGREIEFEGGRDLPSVINKVAGLASYLIQHGDVIKDGQTFGASATERLKVDHAISREIAGLPVLRVMAAASPGGT